MRSLHNLLLSFIFLIAVFILQTVSVFAADLSSYDWGHSIGGTFADYSRTMTVDADGNVYVAGEYNDSGFDADPTGTTENLPTGGGLFEGFVSKYTSDGTYLWTKVFTGTSEMNVRGIKTDTDGNIYISGAYKGTYDFDPSASSENSTSNGNGDAFIVKLDADGEFQWVKTFGGAGNDIAYKVDVSNSGVYLAGRFQQTVNFDTDGGTNNITSSGGTDIFVSYFLSDGTYQWTKSVGGTSTDLLNDIAYSDSKLYLVGYFQGTTDFDPGAGTSNLTSAGGSDVFMLTLDSDGAYIDAIQWGSADWEGADYITVSADGSIYVTGFFEATADMDPTASVNNLTAVGADDFFISKFSSDRTYLWTRSIGGNDYDYIYGLGTDPDNNVYITGEFYEDVDFDPTDGEDTHTSAGSNDVFILHLHSDGSYGWAKTFGSTGDDVGLGLGMNDTRLYITGGYSGTVDIDPTDGTDNKTSVGSVDIFISAFTLSGFDSESPDPTPAPQQSSSGNNGWFSTTEKPHCAASVPLGQPDLFQIDRQDSTSTLHFTPVLGNVNGYHVIFGYTEGDERFGGINMPVNSQTNWGVQSISVSHLDPNAEYWFKVVPINGCAVGEWSNWLKAGKSTNTLNKFYRYMSPTN